MGGLGITPMRLGEAVRLGRVGRRGGLVVVLPGGLHDGGQRGHVGAHGGLHGGLLGLMYVFGHGLFENNVHCASVLVFVGDETSTCK